MNTPMLPPTLLALLLAAPLHAQTAQDIVRQTLDTYASLTSFQADGTSTSDSQPLDQPGGKGVPLAAAPGVAPLKFTLRLARPGLYRVEWERPVHSAYTNNGVIWSAGKGHFLIMSGGRTFQQFDSENQSVPAATGVSGGAAHEMPVLFFKKSLGVSLATLEKPARLADEKVESEDCYVITGQTGKVRRTYWIAKGTHLVRQSRTDSTSRPGQSPQGPRTDEQLARIIKANGEEPTPEAVARVRKMFQESDERRAKLPPSRRTSTLIYRNIRTNEPLKEPDFNVKTPEGRKPEKFEL